MFYIFVLHCTTSISSRQEFFCGGPSSLSVCVTLDPLTNVIPNRFLAALLSVSDPRSESGPTVRRAHLPLFRLFAVRPIILSSVLVPRLLAASRGLHAGIRRLRRFSGLPLVHSFRQPAPTVPARSFIPARQTRVFALISAFCGSVDNLLIHSRFAASRGFQVRFCGNQVSLSVPRWSASAPSTA